MNDIIVGLQYGDEGKGKITHSFVKNRNYTHCVRFNGGPNAGHTIYYNDKKIITHQIPTGIFYNLICVIGSGCVVDLRKLQYEINFLKKLGIDVKKYLKISFNAHIIKSSHISEDILNDKIGSTKSGMRPVYRDKYNRIGKRVCDLKLENQDFEIIDPYEELNKKDIKILFEGAQGFMLDIDWGDYPYVTSSSTLASSVCTTGISLKTINKIYGISKLYTTYVGNKKFQPRDNIFETLQKLGNEVGSTTGRTRQCDWLNLTELKKAIIINGVTDLIINKCDIIQFLGVYKLIENDKIIDFDSIEDMKKYITEYFSNLNIIFSSSKFDI